MRITTAQIFAEFSETGLLTRKEGPDIPVDNAAPPEHCGPGHLVFIDKADHVRLVRQNRPSAVVTNSRLASELTTDVTVLISPDVRLAHALIRSRFFDHDPTQTEWPRRHPTAVIHDTATVAGSAIIGPGVAIGGNVKVEEHTVIMANSVLERGARVGAYTLIHPSVVVGYDCQIGCHVVLKSGCVIGAEGFGFAQDSDGHSHRIPQLGKVVIEDQVVIGANTTIDRATYQETRIRRGTKVDALCHIAHNVDIGEDCLLVAQTGIAGSSRLGKRVITSGQTGILDHVTIPDGTILVHRAGVIKSLEQPGIYASIPPQPLPQYRKNIAAFQRLAELLKRVRKLEKLVARGKLKD